MMDRQKFPTESVGPGNARKERFRIGTKQESRIEPNESKIHLRKILIVSDINIKNKSEKWDLIKIANTLNKDKIEYHPQAMDVLAN